VTFAAFADSLVTLAAQLPLRVIYGELGPYLSRYTLAELPSGEHVYLHRFHRSDADRDLHSHPWAGRSLILRGGYREERRVGLTSCILARNYTQGDINILEPDTFHRVDLLESECWSLFTTSAKVESWAFWNRDTGVTTPWREALLKRGLEVDYPGASVESDRATRAQLPTLPTEAQ
jgi:hypothetical protein